ncbi:MAG: nucleotidyl transferase AbiEii/AbiGii toxin family protein [Candidatus Omnitrophota bacterium]
MAKEKIKTILSKKQRYFLDLFNEEQSLFKKFYLTGGTALAEFYLKHRYSEDLDFFNEEEFSVPPLRAFVKKAEKRLKVEKIEYQNFLGLHAFIFYFKESETLKVDFNFYPFPRILKKLNFKNVMIDSDYDIAVNKVHTIAMQPRARDYIDIYFLVKEKNYDLKDLIMKAKAKFDWHIDALQLGAQLLRAQEVKDYPRMIKQINHREWQDFFVQEAKKLEREVFDGT